MVKLNLPVLKTLLGLVLSLPTCVHAVPLIEGGATRPSRAEDPRQTPQPLLDFLDTSFSRNRHLIENRLGPRYQRLCKALGIPDTVAANRGALLPLLYRHGLLTTTEAVDCRTGGALGTSYLWHWVTPNPRHALRRLPDSTPLIRLPPPPGFAKYKSWADVDRLPALYLGDLAAERARYWHPLCGEIRTFGWCSEREMAFGVLLSALGHRCKIKQEDIHVWSEVLLDLQGPDGKARPSVVAFDNTFDTVEAWPLKGPVSAWAADFGDGAQVGWYNKVAHSPGEIAKVRAVTVTRPASLRMYTQIRDWLGVIER